jgi:predicted O-linked N-acetylglucosamine transferase (SPINDLY family)
MGIIGTQPPALSPANTSETAIATWLDSLLAAATTLWDAPEILRRLAGTPFHAILACFERAAADRRFEAALYQSWIAANPSSPYLWAAWFNLGARLAQDQNPAAAGAYSNALVLRPDLHEAAINLGLLQEAAGRTEEALATWSRATQPDAARIALQIQQGRLLEDLGRFPEAEAMLRQVLLTDPENPDVLHHWVHLRQKTCSWPVAVTDIPGLTAAAQLTGSGPFGIMALTDNIALQAAAGSAWVARKTTAAPRRLAPTIPYTHAKIRIGYISSDFCQHAMSYLITELFERHDRKNFEVYGYCASEDDGSALRRRVLAGFDHHRIIRGLTDEQAAEKIRADEIDILIELNGITDGSRLAVLRWRPAPIQASYLGFVGPIPLPELDFLLCDTVVIPPEHFSAYQPQPLPIAKLYQANDSKRTIGRSLTRAELGLPESAFLFCCFSKHYKITAEIFAAWMEILHQTPHSVLWLAADNEHSQKNLTQAAAAAGIAPERLIVSDRTDPDLYLSRLALADLFLDTFPYNAGTVASDALRMNLPLITLCGEAFASRMAASLLHAMGATSGITTTLKTYISLATRLANDAKTYAGYKARFTPAAWRQSVGNIEDFTRQFESTIKNLIPRGPGVPVFTPGLASILHVGCGAAAPEKLPDIFRNPGWQEIRLDIDPAVHPDIIASLTDMSIIPDASIDAVYSSHNVEHLFAHEVALALQEMRRVCRKDGFVLIQLPDLQEVARHVAAGALDAPLYHSPMGPIAPLDIFFGHRAAVAGGNIFMAHRTGFTAATLAAALLNAGFAAAMVQRNTANFALTALAFPNPSNSMQTRPSQIFDAAAAPPVLYTAAPDAAANARTAPQTSSPVASEASADRQTLDASATASFALALRCAGQGRGQDAIDAYCDAIAKNPHYVDAYINLGTLVLTAGQHDQAAALLRRAIALDPGNAMAHGNLGKALQDSNQLDDAIAAYRTAIALQPENPISLINLGAAFLEQKSWADAAALTRQALAIAPDSAMAQANLATALLNLGRHDEALAAARAAVALNPQNADILASLGGVMLELGAWHEAARLCRGAIAANPALPIAYFNLSHAQKTLNQLDAAESACRQAIALRPAPEYHFHLAHILLLQGRLEAGFEEYEWRWQLPDFAGLAKLRKNFTQPEYRGETSAGKTILVTTEQGLGDIIQFARYLPLLARRCTHVIVAAHPPLHRLLQTIAGITIVSLLDPLPDFDAHCALLSLPRAFATDLTTIPAATPYLHADAAAQKRWSQSRETTALRVGIVWAGNPLTQRDRFRSPGLSSVTPLFSIPGVEFMILQMGPGRAALTATTLPPNVTDPGEKITDLADTAAIMTTLDLVISSCTAPLHLAGALDVPVWAMLPFAPHFPWLLERTDTLWYKTMRLYRQDAPGRDWAPLVARIAADLAALAEKKSRRTRPRAKHRHAAPLA